MCALPTILKTGANLVASIGAGGAQRLAGTSGVETVLRIYQCTGLTSTYTRTLAAHASGIVTKATWTYSRIGGAGPAEILVKGGLADMDTAAQNEWEVELERGDPVVWYRGRIVGYKHETTPNGDTMTRLFCEGYLTKLAQIKIDKDYTSQTVKVIVQDILDTYVTPNTRIAYAAADIVGAYTVNSISFKGRTVLEAIEMLGMLQGSTEWGVTEGNPKPQFYFLADGSGTSEAQVLQLGKDASEMTAEGTFGTGYSTVKVIGGWSGGVIVTGTYTDTTAQTTYGKREKVISDSAILNATDANRLAQNYAAVYANGSGRYGVKIYGPTARIEPNRTSGSIAASKKATIRGIDGAQVTDFFGSVVYKYESSSPPSIRAEVRAGLPEECIQQVFTALDRTVQSLVQQVQQYDTGTAAHTILSTTHTDTTASSLIRGDILVVDLNTKLVRLATGSGNAGRVLRSDTVDTKWSTLAIPDTISDKALLYASATNVLSELGTQANSVLVTDGSTPPIPTFSNDLPTVTMGGAPLATTTAAVTFSVSDVNALKTLSGGSVSTGPDGALATGATAGFLYGSTAAGTPTGTPTPISGKAATVYDSTNKVAYTYDAGTSKWRPSYSGGYIAATSSGTITVDVTEGHEFSYELTGNATLNASGGGVAGASLYILIRSDAAVARVATFGTNFLSTGTLTTPATAGLIVSAAFVSNGTNWIEVNRQTAGV